MLFSFLGCSYGRKYPILFRLGPIFERIVQFDSGSGGHGKKTGGIDLKHPRQIRQGVNQALLAAMFHIGN